MTGNVHMALDKRADISVAMSGRKILCELKRDYHPDVWTAADIAHELAHGLLLHPPKPPFNAAGSRHYDAVLEAEANWLGPALLISDEAALLIVERQLPMPDATRRYGASAPLIRIRLNVSGAVVRVARRRAA